MQKFSFMLERIPFDLDHISLYVGIFSIVLALVSIFYAIKCNKDANKLNRQTSDMLLDIQYIMTFNLRAVCELQLRMPKKSLPPNTVYLEKDSFEIHKLSTFDKKQSNEVMKLLEKLSVKKSTLDNLQKFIMGNKKDFATHFCSTANTIDQTRLDFLVVKLSQYGVLLDIYTTQY